VQILCHLSGSGSSFVILAELWSCGQGAARSPHDGVEALDVRVQGTPTRPERWRSATSATPVTLSPGHGLPPEPGVNLRRDQPPISFTKPEPEPFTVQVHSLRHWGKQRLAERLYDLIGVASTPLNAPIKQSTISS